MDRTLLYSIAAGICTFLGAVIVFYRPRISRKELAFFLGLASGVMVAVVVFDLIPSGMVKGEFMGFLIGGIWGAVLIAVMNYLISNNDHNKGKHMARIGYLIMLGIAVHDLPEGMAIALGYELSSKTAAVIALGIGIHNMPEGMAIAAPLIMAGCRRRKIAAEVLLVGMVTPLGTILGKLAIAFLPQFFSIFLGLAAGIMLYLVIFQLWPEAKNTGSRWRYPGAVLGMIVILAATII